jgi:uncharacterized protein YbbC (DUF1343 family)
MRFIPALLALLLLSTGCQHHSIGPKTTGQTLPGIDVFAERGFDSLKGKRVGLITNHTGLTRGNRSTIDVLHERNDFELVALFSPEHGIRGDADAKVESGKDSKTGLMVHSLYGKTRKPTPEMLAGVEVLVFDITDIGTRFYTYIGTMSKSMEAAREANIPFIVLDRPNAIGGSKVEGAVLPPDLAGAFTAIHPIPTRHGMTMGELALLFNAEFGIGCDLEVIPMEGWERTMHYDDTGLLWVNPSPNMKTLNGAILYPGPGAAETTTIAVGRGTDRPFEMYGAPYMNGEVLAAEMASRNTPGVRWVPFVFTPTAPYHKFKDERCEGVFAIVTDRDQLDSVTAGLHLVQAMHQLYPEQFQAEGGFATHTGDPEIWSKLTEQNLTPEQVVEAWQPDLDRFLATRSRYLLYR